MSDYSQNVEGEMWAVLAAGAFILIIVLAALGSIGYAAFRLLLG